jgi:putative membrane protein
MTFEIVRGLHILAVIAWMAGLLFLPRLYAYDAEQADKAEPLRSEMRDLLRAWQDRLLKIIMNGAMAAAWIFGLWMIGIHMFDYGSGWGFLAQPWMAAKLAGIVALSAWHGFLAAERKRIIGGTSTRTGKFWRMTNEIPFVIAVVIVLSATTQWAF